MPGSNEVLEESLPISESQESSARAILQPLDNEKEKTVNGRTQDYKPEPR